MLLDDLEVFLASAAAGDDLDIGAAGVFDRLKHADGGFVIQAVNRVDLLVRREDIGEILQAVFTGESGRVLDHVHFRRDLLDRVGEALHAQLGNAAAGRNRKRHDGAGGADLLDDVLGGLNAHALVVAGHAIHAVRVDDDIEVHDRDTGINRVLNRHFHAFPLRERNDRLSAPGHEIVQLGGHFLGVVRGIELVVHFVRQGEAFLLSVIGDARNPAVRNGRRENADLVLVRRRTHGAQRHAQHQRKSHSQNLFHTVLPPQERSFILGAGWISFSPRPVVHILARADFHVNSNRFIFTDLHSFFTFPVPPSFCFCTQSNYIQSNFVRSFHYLFHFTHPHAIIFTASARKKAFAI